MLWRSNWALLHLIYNAGKWERECLVSVATLSKLENRGFKSALLLVRWVVFFVDLVDSLSYQPFRSYNRWIQWFMLALSSYAWTVCMGLIALNHKYFLQDNLLIEIFWIREFNWDFQLSLDENKKIKKILN